MSDRHLPRRPDLSPAAATPTTEELPAELTGLNEAIVQAYVEGELTGADLHHFEEVLRFDPALRRLVGDLILDRQKLRQLPQHRAPAQVNDAIEQAIERQVLLGPSTRHAPIGAPPSSYRMGRWAAGFAMAALVVLAASLVVTTFRDIWGIQGTLNLASKPQTQQPTPPTAPASALASKDKGPSREQPFSDSLLRPGETAQTDAASPRRGPHAGAEELAKSKETQKKLEHQDRAELRKAVTQAAGKVMTPSPSPSPHATAPTAEVEKRSEARFEVSEKQFALLDDPSDHLGLANRRPPHARASQAAAADLTKPQRPSPEMKVGSRTLDGPVPLNPKATDTKPGNQAAPAPGARHLTEASPWELTADAAAIYQIRGLKRELALAPPDTQTIEVIVQTGDIEGTRSQLTDWVAIHAGLGMGGIGAAPELESATKSSTPPAKPDPASIGVEAMKLQAQDGQGPSRGQTRRATDLSAKPAAANGVEEARDTGEAKPLLLMDGAGTSSPQDEAEVTLHLPGDRLPLLLAWLNSSERQRAFVEAPRLNRGANTTGEGYSVAALRPEPGATPTPAAAQGPAEAAGQGGGSVKAPAKDTLPDRKTAANVDDARGNSALPASADKPAPQAPASPTRIKEKPEAPQGADLADDASPLKSAAARAQVEPMPSAPIHRGDAAPKPDRAPAAAERLREALVGPDPLDPLQTPFGRLLLEQLPLDEPLPWDQSALVEVRVRFVKSPARASVTPPAPAQGKPTTR